MDRDPTFPDREPPAEIREMAKQMHYIYVAMIHAGFTEEQAMHLLATSLSTALAGM
jgi:hypothetical protein